MQAINHRAILSVLFALISGTALADSTIQNIPTNATSPLPVNSCFPIAQFVNGSYGDAKLCTGYLTALGASAMATAPISPSGDVSGAWPILTVQAVNANIFPAGFQPHQVPIAIASSVFTAKTIPNCLDTAGQHLNYAQTGDNFVCGTSGGATTSVGLSVPAASIFGVTGSPVTSTGTLGLTTTGTSGGVPYFSSASALSSSAALTASNPVLGGGAGGAPTSGSRSGSTTIFATANGVLTNGHCVAIDALGNFVDSGGACGGSGGTGSVTSVGVSVPGSSIFGVTGSPVTISGTIGITTTGTSGGVPYFSSTSAISSSALLSANNPVLGGGAGAAPVSGSRSGSTTTFATTTGTLTNGHCVAIDVSGNLLDSGGACGGSGGSGSVTSVGLSVPGASIFGVTGTPVTVAGTLGLTTTGTSGGIPYFSSASVLSSSNALTANAPVIGGGAGTPPSVGSRSGNTTVFATASGALTNGDCIKADSNGNIVDSGGPCSTVNVGVANNLAYYPSNTNSISPLATANNGVLVTSGAGAPSISTVIPNGVLGTTQGQTDNSQKLATTGFVKSQQWAIPISWIAAQNPNNAILIGNITQGLTVQAVGGRVESAVGAAATVTVLRAPSGTACSAGTALTSNSLNANGTAAATQSLTVTFSSLSAGDSLCLQTTGGSNWTSGSGIGNITVYVTQS